MKTLPAFCFETLAHAIALQKIPGFEAIENIKLLSGEDGGGIQLYRGEKIARVSLVEFRLGSGVPIPHYDNQPAARAEVFQILPDLSYKLPIWGINSVIMKDGTYHFDTDLSFGFDLVTDYDFTMKYLEPFNATYQKFCNHPHLRRVTLDKTTTWVRTYISPVFIIAETSLAKVQTVYNLCAEFIKLWISMYSDADKKDEHFKARQQQRMKAQYEGMRATDRMGKVLMGAYGQDTFTKFFKAMA